MRRETSIAPSTSRMKSTWPDPWSNLDLLTTEQSLVTLDAAVASSDAGLIQLQIDVFKALGGGWHNESLRSP